MSSDAHSQAALAAATSETASTARRPDSSARFLSLTYPVLAIILLGGLVLAWTLHDARERQKDIIIGLSQHTMAATVRERQASLNLVLADYAYWNETLDFVQTLDDSWAQQEIGENLVTPFGLAASVLMSQSGKILWWHADEELTQDESLKHKLEKSLWDEKVMSRLMNGWQDVPAKPRSAFFLFNDQLYFLHGALITSDEEGYRGGVDDRSALLLLKRFDQGYLDTLVRHKQVTDIQLKLGSAQEPVNGEETSVTGAFRAQIPLMGLHGTQLAELSWSPAFSVDSVFDALSPSILGLMSVILGCFIWYVSRIRAGVAILDREILSRKQAEKELLAQQVHLESLVAARTHELYEALESVRKSSQEKSKFSARMSHELRTPLNAISGFSQLLQSELSDPELSAYISEVLTASQRMTDIVDQAIQFASLSDTLSQQNRICSPLTLLTGLTERYRVLASRRSLEVIWVLPDESVQCALPGEVFRESVMALLDNAIQYSDDGARIHVFSEVKDGVLRMSVSDQGVGIPEDKVSGLFQPFSRLHFELYPNIEGLGLSLFIASKKLSMYGADIEYQPNSGTGCCFTLSLPVCHQGSSRD